MLSTIAVAYIKTNQFGPVVLIGINEDHQMVDHGDFGLVQQLNSGGELKILKIVNLNICEIILFLKNIIFISY